MIKIESGLLESPQKLAEEIFKRDVKGSFAIVSDEQIGNLYGKTLLKALLELNTKAFLFTFTAGEKYKTRKTKEELENQMFEKGLGSDTTLIALGGGVTTDLAGFLASTYCRGISFISIPTTLLAMADASIGGKNGVNCDYGKNLIGTTYQPQRVIIDPGILKTLNMREIKSGLVEIIKHALIFDADLFEYLKTYSKEILSLQNESLEKIIRESCRIKLQIIEENQTMKGKRHLLNFGHTVGHALEKLSSYALSHGEAVAVGIRCESQIAHQLGFLQKSSLDKIQDLFSQYGINTVLEEKFSIEALLEAMTLDKKSIDGKPRFVILEEIGKCSACDGAFCQTVDEELLKSIL